MILKPTHKPIRAYYAALVQFEHLGITHETAVRSAFQALLEHCGRQCQWTLVPEYAITRPGKRRIVVDGAMIDDFQLTHGIWEAKDIHDDLPSAKTCSWPGEVKNNLGGAKVMVGSDGQRMDRDINGARGIFPHATSRALLNEFCKLTQIHSTKMYRSEQQVAGLHRIA